MRATMSLLTLAIAVGAPAAAQPSPESSGLEARVWLDRGDEPVVQRGDDVRVYYRTSEDVYAAIFRIDTDGVVRLIHPAHPGAATEPTRGGRDYRLLFPSSARWEVSDDPGVGYFFIVAAPRPLDFSSFRFLPGEDRWDLGDVGARVYEDPYLAIDDFVAALIPDWELAEYTLDFLQYDVGESQGYPRFLCYDCHESRSYAAWNPYAYACTSFRVVIWDDPYFYPAYRYSGTRVVFTVPIRNRPRFTVVVRGPGDGWSPLVRRRSPPRVATRPTRYKEPGTARGAERATPERRALPTRKPEPTTGVAPRRTAQPRGGASASTGRPATRRAPSAVAGGSVTRRSESAPPARRPAAAVRGGSRSAGSARSGPSRATPSRAPITRSRPVTRAKPTTRARPSGRVGSRSNPVTRANPVTRSRPGTRAAPVTRSRPATRSAPITRPRPVTRAAPMTRSRPGTRSTPVTRSRPAAGARRPPVRARPSTTRAPVRATPSRARARPKPPPRRRPGG